jgi:hypothetical protein
MVQVDVFWSYGLSSGLALAASRQIRKMPEPWFNRYFVATLAWTAMIFAPSGAYLLWAFPGWETMFVAAQHRDIPAWLVAAFGLTNVTQGVLGYYITWRLLRSGRDFAAMLQPIWSHLAMLFILVFGWDGSGWRRFTYAGTGEEWHSGVTYPWTDFFRSEVFYTLLGMGVFFIPTYFGLIRKWRKEAVPS